jgi:hypothetical protein
LAYLEKQPTYEYVCCNLEHFPLVGKDENALEIKETEKKWLKVSDDLQKFEQTKQNWKKYTGILDQFFRYINFIENNKFFHYFAGSFFIFTESGWINTRADREIEHFKGKIAQASNAGKASAERRLNVRSTGVQPNNKQEPITNKHKPINNITAAPEGVSVDVWYSFVEQRKKSRAVITETVINSIQKEANKAGWTLEMALAECAARGWRGFKAEWVRTESEKQFNQPQSKAMLGVMLVQQEIDRLKNEGTENEILEN